MRLMPPLDTKRPAPTAHRGDVARASPREAAPSVPSPPTPPLADAYLAHRDWLTRALAWRYGPEEADDIAQDTWLKVHGYAPPGPVRSAKSLLMRIARNVAANRLRKTGRESATDPHAPLLDPAAPGEQEQAVAFEQMMLALPPKLRDVFALNHVRGLTYREIAQLRGISVKAVEKRMTQAIARCAEMMRG
jgi:RNA polymerase sigma factor (sigma-70 family)